jgi:hypothetical protein
MSSDESQWFFRASRPFYREPSPLAAKPPLAKRSANFWPIIGRGNAMRPAVETGHFYQRQRCVLMLGKGVAG